MEFCHLDSQQSQQDVHAMGLNLRLDEHDQMVMERPRQQRYG